MCSVWIFLLVGLETAQNRKVNPHLVLGPYRVPTWALLLLVIVCTEALIPSTSLTGHMCGVAVGYVCMSCYARPLTEASDKRVEFMLLTGSTGGLGLLKWLCPPEKVLRWIESKLSLRRRLPNYASVDQKAYGRFGVLPTNGVPDGGIELGSV